MKMQFIFGVVLLALTASASADAGYWLNIVGGDFVLSYPMMTENQCSASLADYVRSGLVNFASCDVQPMPGAENMLAVH